jgi:hypothetical protein
VEYLANNNTSFKEAKEQWSGYGVEELRLRDPGMD